MQVRHGGLPAMKVFKSSLTQYIISGVTDYQPGWWHFPQASVLEGNDQGELCACFAVSSFFVEQARSSFHKARNVLEEDEVILLHACCT